MLCDKVLENYKYIKSHQNAVEIFTIVFNCLTALVQTCTHFYQKFILNVIYLSGF